MSRSLLFAAAALMLVACDGRREATQGSKPYCELTAPMVPGTYELAMTMNMSVTTPGPTVRVGINLDAEIDIEAQPGGRTYRAATRFTRLTAQAMGNSYDSDDAPSSHAGARPQMQPSNAFSREMQRVWDKFREINVIAIVGDDREVRRWEGLEAGRFDAEVRQMLEGFITEEGVTWTLDGAGYFLPDEPVGERAIWHTTVARKLEGVPEFPITLECELTSIELVDSQRYAVIEYTGHAHKSNVMINGERVSSMRMKMTGTLRRNLTNPAPVRHDSNIKVDFNVKGQSASTKTAMTYEARRVGE